MSDLPSRSEQGEGFLEEIEEGTIIDNTLLLRMKLIGPQLDDPEDEKTKLALFGIKNQGTQYVKGEIQHSIITYNTRTGEISPCSGEYLGDFSVLRTILVKKMLSIQNQKTPKEQYFYIELEICLLHGNTMKP